MTQAEIKLIEAGWTALVERLGLAEATRFVMLMDRRTGGGVQHLQHLWSGSMTGRPRHSVSTSQSQSVGSIDA
jgi:hypothetical protein